MVQRNTVIFRHPAARRKGNAALVVVILIMVVVGVYFVNTLRQDPTGPVNEFPWTEENRLAGVAGAIQLPGPAQYQLKDALTFSRTVQDEGQNRGHLQVEINSEGYLDATWKASYKEGDYEKDVSAGFLGNVDASMPYEDENGIDASKLFFIAKGKFIVQAFKKNGRAQAGGGDTYLVGWIDPDGKANGTLVLAPDKKNTKIYTW